MLKTFVGASTVEKDGQVFFRNRVCNSVSNKIDNTITGQRIVQIGKWPVYLTLSAHVCDAVVCFEYVLLPNTLAFCVEQLRSRDRRPSLSGRIRRRDTTCGDRYTTRYFLITHYAHHKSFRTLLSCWMHCPKTIFHCLRRIIRYYISGTVDVCFTGNIIYICQWFAYEDFPRFSRGVQKFLTIHIYFIFRFKGW